MKSPQNSEGSGGGRKARRTPRTNLAHAAAASYVGVDVKQFDLMVKRGVLPLPKVERIEGQRVWDSRALDKALDDANRASKRRAANAHKGGRRGSSVADNPDWPKSAILVAVKSEFKLDISTAAAVIAPLFTAYPLSLRTLQKHGATATRLIADFSSPPQIRSAHVRLSVAAAPRSATTALFRKHQLLASRMDDDEWKAMVSDIEAVRQMFESIRAGNDDGIARALSALCAKRHWLNMIKYIVKRAEVISVEDGSTSTSITAMTGVFTRIAQLVILEFDQNRSLASTA